MFIYAATNPLPSLPDTNPLPLYPLPLYPLPVLFCLFEVDRSFVTTQKKAKVKKMPEEEEDLAEAACNLQTNKVRCIRGRDGTGRDGTGRDGTGRDGTGPGFSCPRTLDIHTLVPRKFIPSYPGFLSPRTPDVYPLVPWIFIPSYPGYLSPRTSDIYPLVPRRIFIPSYPGYLSPRTPDIYFLVPRIYIPSCST